MVKQLTVEEASALAVEEDPEDQPTELNALMFQRQPLELGTLYQTRALFSEEEFRTSKTYKTTMQPIGAGHWSGVHDSISGDWRAALPLLVLTADGRMQMANALGQRLVDAGQLMDVSASGQLSLLGAENQRALSEAIQSCLASSSPSAFQAEVDDTVLALCVCPFLPALSFNSRIDEKIFEKQQLVTVFVGARSVGAINVALLRDAFMLSQREAEVCSELLLGETPSDIATKTGRSEKTIRNQIHTLHDKIGVKSTRELTDALAVFRTAGAMFDG